MTMSAGDLSQYGDYEEQRPRRLRRKMQQSPQEEGVKVTP
jgi:hypothetical protein